MTITSDTGKRIKGIFKNKKGMSYVYVAVILLTMVIIFSFVLEYASVFTLAQNTKNNVQMELDEYLVLKSNEIYEAIINKKNTAASECTDEFLTDLSDKLSLQLKAADTWYNPDDPNKVEYIFDNPMTVEITDKNILILQLEYTVVIPFYIGTVTDVDILIPMKVKAQYNITYEQ